MTQCGGPLLIKMYIKMAVTIAIIFPHPKTFFLTSEDQAISFPGMLWYPLPKVNDHWNCRILIGGVMLRIVPDEVGMRLEAGLQYSGLGHIPQSVLIQELAEGAVYASALSTGCWRKRPGTSGTVSSAGL